MPAKKEERERENCLFNKPVMDLLYAQQVFSESAKTEGAFSNAKAVVQLR